MISFITKISAAFFAMFMPLIVAFNGISISLPFMNDIAVIEYDFANDKAGSAAGARLGEIVATHVIPRPHPDVEKILPSIK